MAYPYPLETSHPSANIQSDSPREVGPYEYGGGLYVFNYYDNSTFGDDGIIHDVKIVCYKSTDAGVSWSMADESNSPAAYHHNLNGYAVATVRDDATVFVAFSRNGGEVIEGALNPQLSVVEFDLASDTWGSPTTDGPTIYGPGVFPTAPPGGYGNPWSGGLTVGVSIDWGQISVVRRSSGELVCLFDSHDLAHENAGGGFFGYYYRRVSLIRYSSGSWSTAYVFFDDEAYLRDYFPGSVGLDSDGSTVHILIGSAGQPDEGDLPWLGVARNIHLHYTNIDETNSVLTPDTLSTDLDYHFGWHSIAPSVFAGGEVHTLYRKSDATLAVMSGTSGDWTENTLATIEEGSDLSLCAGLGVSSGSLYAVYLNGPYSAGRTVYYQAYSSGTWASGVSVETLEGNFGLEMFSSEGLSGGLGFLGFMGTDPYPYSYYQIDFAGGGGPTEAARYYGR